MCFLNRSILFVRLFNAFNSCIDIGHFAANTIVTATSVSGHNGCGSAFTDREKCESLELVHFYKDGIITTFCTTSDTFRTIVLARESVFWCILHYFETVISYPFGNLVV